jgi:hypothetical protein
MQYRHSCGFGGIRFLHVRGFGYWSFKDYLISSIIFANNIGADPEGLGRKKFRIWTQTIP